MAKPKAQAWEEHRPSSERNHGHVSKDVDSKPTQIQSRFRVTSGNTA